MSPNLFTLPSFPGVSLEILGVLSSKSGCKNNTHSFISASQCSCPGLSELSKPTGSLDLVSAIFNPSSQLVMGHVRTGCLKDGVSSRRPAGCPVFSTYLRTLLDKDGGKTFARLKFIAAVNVFVMRSIRYLCYLPLTRAELLYLIVLY